MQVARTVKIPVHYATTKRKLDILNRLTARLTFGVRLWSLVIETNHIRTRSGLRKRELEQEVRVRTGLSAGFVQCCADTALWMWKSYWKLHRRWRQGVTWAQREGDERLFKKLTKREPRPPSQTGFTKRSRFGSTIELGAWRPPKSSSRHAS